MKRSLTSPTVSEHPMQSVDFSNQMLQHKHKITSYQPDIKSIDWFRCLEVR